MFNKYNSNSSYNSFTADFYYNDFKQLFLDNINQQEILMIGKLSTFKNRMDKLYYDLLNHISDNSKFKITFVDSKTCEKNKPLSFYVNKYCSTNNPIIYNIVYTDNPNKLF